mmetsp:Transcript_132054/g.282451  ORF Transcript_132054/g.282451 Transcript_132054/m.282451 type:complete len:298 (-) Transcript_132054:76-969(-)
MLRLALQVVLLALCGPLAAAAAEQQHVRRSRASFLRSPRIRAAERGAESPSLRRSLRHARRVVKPTRAPTASERTLLALDTNHDGTVDPSEISEFATAQGLDAATASQEFSALDANGDGTLDAEELSHALTEPAPAAMPTEAAPVMDTAPALVPGLAVAAPVDSSVSFTSSDLAASTAQVLSTSSSDRGEASNSANVVVDSLKTEAKDEEEAQGLEHKALELRANASNLARQSAQRATAAGTKAAKAKAEELLQSLTQLERKAAEAEVEAAALRAKSHAELAQADELMGVADPLLAN